MNQKPKLVTSLADSGAFSEPFVLLDVGASGGIAPTWSAFGDALIAHGFDPLVAEVERLNESQCATGTVKYFDAYIVSNDERLDDRPYDPLEMAQRSSAVRALQLSGEDYTKSVFNSGADVRLSQNRYSVDAFVQEHGLDHVDFIKTDTDGRDYPVLLGAEKTLRQRAVLGVAAEVQFNPKEHPHANSFSNVDSYLRELGFSLFNIVPYRYSKAALPDKFRYNIPAQTFRGQVIWADVVYLRDFADARFPERWPHLRPTAHQLLKSIALFEIFDLNDCAMELVNVYAGELGEICDPEQLRQTLLVESHGETDYGAWMERFKSYVCAGRYAAFPDDDVILESGVLMGKPATPNLVFRKD